MCRSLTGRGPALPTVAVEMGVCYKWGPALPSVAAVVGHLPFPVFAAAKEHEGGINPAPTKAASPTNCRGRILPALQLGADTIHSPRRRSWRGAKMRPHKRNEKGNPILGSGVSPGGEGVQESRGRRGNLAVPPHPLAAGGIACYS